jgi:hypothetical protein
MIEVSLAEHVFHAIARRQRQTRIEPQWPQACCGALLVHLSDDSLFECRCRWSTADLDTIATEGPL